MGRDASQACLMPLMILTVRQRNAQEQTCLWRVQTDLGSGPGFNGIYSVG